MDQKYDTKSLNLILETILISQTSSCVSPPYLFLAVTIFLKIFTLFIIRVSFADFVMFCKSRAIQDVKSKKATMTSYKSSPRSIF